MKPGISRGSTISYSVENSLWKRLWTCRKAGYEMNDDLEHGRVYMKK
jgi:hypothetical protein